MTTFRVPKVLLLSAALAAASLHAGEARIHGFFVQPELGYGATDYQSFNSQNEWNAWMKQMADLGAEMIFYQWTMHYQQESALDWYTDPATAYPSAPSPGDYAHYDTHLAPLNGVSSWSWSRPTSWPGTPSQGGKESVTYLLDAAQANGMKAWLGLYLCEGDTSNFCNWWKSQDIDDVIDPGDSIAIEYHVQRSIQVAQELISIYGEHEGLGGLYMSIEPANITFMGPETRKVLASAIDRVAKAVHTAKPGLKLSICPFFNTALSTAEEFGSVWEYVIEHSDLDVLMLQDGVGVEPQTLTASQDLVSPWYAALRAAADKKGIEFWGNSELFTNLGTRQNVNLIPSTAEKVTLQLETEAPYVDKFVCFAFSYLDPTKNTFAALDLSQRTALYNGLKDYWETWKANHQTSVAARPAAVGSWRAVPGGALVRWNGKAAAWALFDEAGRRVTQGLLEPGDNVLGWGPVAPGRYFWKAGSETRSVGLF